MAMSSLSSQLAALSSGAGKSASSQSGLAIGTYYTSSRKEEDKFGRGIHYSSRVGHGLVGSSGRNRRRQPTFLSTEIPTPALREDAVEALEELYQQTGIESFRSNRDDDNDEDDVDDGEEEENRDLKLLFGKQSLAYDAVLQRANDESERMIDSALSRFLMSLSIAMGTSSSNSNNNDAHLLPLEYLLRVYSIHIRTPNELLLLSLPHHDSHPHLLASILKLVDVASLPSWSFLRPHAALAVTLKEQDIATTNILGRTSLAKRAAKDDCLLNTLCQLVAKSMSVTIPSPNHHFPSMDTHDAHFPTAPAQRGTSKIISFCTAVLLESMDLQCSQIPTASTVQSNLVAGLLSEPTVRTLLPHIFAACGPNDHHDTFMLASSSSSSSSWDGIRSPDYRAYGRILANATSDRADCTWDVKEALANRLLRGALAVISSPTTSNNHNNNQDAMAVEEMADGILAMMTVLVGRQKQLSHHQQQQQQQQEESHFFPLIQSKTTNNNTNNNNKSSPQIYWIGLERLPRSTYYLLSSSAAASSVVLSRALARLYLDYHIDITNILASLLSMAIYDLIPKPMKPKKKNKMKKQSSVTTTKAKKLLMSLVTEPLLATLWNNESNNELAISLSAHIVTTYMRFLPTDQEKENEDDDDNRFLHDCRSLLHTMQRTFQQELCDAGIAHAMIMTLNKEKDDDAYRYKGRLARLLSKEQHNNKDKNETLSLDMTHHLLPSRVALEHYDASVRLVAITRLLDEMQSINNIHKEDNEDTMMIENNNNSNNDDDDDHHNIQDLCRLLLRRVALDDNVEVLIAAAKAISDNIVSNNAIGTLFREAKIVDDILQSLDRWSILREIQSFEMEQIKATRRIEKKQKKKKKKKKKKQQQNERRKSHDTQSNDDGDHDDDDDDDGEDDNDTASAKRGSSSSFNFDSISKERVNGLCEVLRLLGFIGSAILHELSPSDAAQDEVVRRLVQGIVCHIDLGNKTNGAITMENATETIYDRIGNAAAESMLRALNVDQGERIVENGNTIFDATNKLLCENEFCLEILRQSCSDQLKNDYDSMIDKESSPSNFLRIHFFRTMLMTHVKNINTDADSSSMALSSSDALNLALAVLHCATKKIGMDNEQIASLHSCFRFCARDMSTSMVQLPNTIAQIASVPSKSTYKNIATPVIRTFLEVCCCKESINENRELYTPTSLLMEVCVRPNTSSEIILRLLSLATTIIKDETDSKKTSSALEDGLVPALTLLSHVDKSVRVKTIDYLSMFESKATTGSIHNDVHVAGLHICSVATRETSPLRSDIVMDGATALTNLIRDAANTFQNVSFFQKTLAHLCVSTAGVLPTNTPAAAAAATATTKESKLLPISPNVIPGRCCAAWTILSAMEKTGESTFPLSIRWEHAGHDLCAAFLSPCNPSSSSSSNNNNNNNNKEDDNLDSPGKAHAPATIMLVDHVVSMLKGVMLKDDAIIDNLVISTGPSVDGRRSRSYSVGAHVGTAFMDPYPETMSSTLIQCLLAGTKKHDENSLHQNMCEAALRLVVGRQSWADDVYPKLPLKIRRKFASVVLDLRCHYGNSSAGSALMGLPLQVPDFCAMLSMKNLSSSSSSDSVESDDSSVWVIKLTILADCIRAKVKDLTPSTERMLGLSSLLFDHLKALSTVSKGEDTLWDDEYEYARSSLLQTLQSMFHDAGTGKEKHRGNYRPRSNSKDSPADADMKGIMAISQQAELLVSLLSGHRDDSSTLEPLAATRDRMSALSLLTHLCSFSPDRVVGSLVPAMTRSILPPPGSESSRGIASTTARNVLLAVVPIYCAHAHNAAGMSLSQLFNAFHNACSAEVWKKTTALSKKRIGFYKDVADALLEVDSESWKGMAIGSFVGTIAAASVHQLCILEEPDIDDSVSFDQAMYKEEYETKFVGWIMEIFRQIPGKIVISSFLKLLEWFDLILSRINSVPYTEDNEMLEVSEGKFAGAPSVSDIVDMALKGPLRDADNSGHSSFNLPFEKLDPKQKKAMTMLSTKILVIVRDGITLPTVKRTIKRSSGDDATNCLKLWQALMQTQAMALRIHSEVSVSSDTNGTVTDEATSGFNLTSAEIAGNCLESLQRYLPVPHFIASASSLFSDNDIDPYVRKRTIRVLSDRVSDTAPNSAEAKLFMEMIPDLSELLTSSEGTGEEEDDPEMVIVQQAALLGIVSLAQLVHASAESGNHTKASHEALVKSLKIVTSILNRTAILLTKSIGNKTAINNVQSQLLSSAALCSSTLIVVLNAKCLPLLSQVVKPLVTSLSTVNSWIQEEKGDGKRAQGQIPRLLQLSVLRTLVAVAEVLPQFSVPYLDSLFAASALPSDALRSGEDASMNAMMERLESALSTKIPARQFIPAATKAVTQCLKQGRLWKEAVRVISLITMSIKSSLRSQVSPVVGKILNAMMSSYSYDGEEEARSVLVSTANSSLIALVMKLSEAQLRPLYARLRVWRGDFDKSNIDRASSLRRHAFWSLTAAFNKELRSIFLPCMSTVVADAVSELDFMASKLCVPKRSERKMEGKKRRRLNEDDTNNEVFNVDAWRPMQSLLLCIELALKSDAHEGGLWVRNDDGRRYHAFLEPLSKLLRAEIPAEFAGTLNSGDGSHSARNLSPFQIIVQGSGDDRERGSVVGCLTALATAAGNESLWKPLNHALLEACGHEERSEVRKAGVSALLSNIETLGEEYMVLLPECLPVLSELLEDGDEEIAALAQECVKQGEDLLGESLEDSLR